SVDEREDRRGRPEPGYAGAAERLPPQPEEVAERRPRPRPDLDHAGRVDGAERVGAAAAAREPDRARDDQHLAAHEQLDVDAEAAAARVRAAQPADRRSRADGRRCGRKAEARPGADRPGLDVGRQGGAAERERDQEADHAARRRRRTRRTAAAAATTAAATPATIHGQAGDPPPPLLVPPPCATLPVLPPASRPTS